MISYQVIQQSDPFHSSKFRWKSRFNVQLFESPGHVNPLTIPIPGMDFLATKKCPAEVRKSPQKGSEGSEQ